MKGRNKILILVLSIIFLSGCTDYLDRQPLDKISSSTFWKTKNDFNMALTAIYGLNESGAWNYELPNWDNLTDNSYGQHNYNSSKSIVAGDITSTTGGYISNVYSFCYKAIARVNIYLKELSAYKGTDMTDAEKKVAEGEVRFLRAYYYFQLYCAYGDVPLVAEPLTIENQEQAKVTSDKIYAQVISDLDIAIANLKTVPYYQNSGHVTKTTAQALKARVLIYQAYGSNGTPDNGLLSQVKSLCQEITPQYALSPVFEKVFQDKGQNGNKEIIYSVNYLAPDNVPSYGG
jgi:hypothetical protein